MRRRRSMEKGAGGREEEGEGWASHMRGESDGEHMSAPVCFLKHISLSLPSVSLCTHLHRQSIAGLPACSYRSGHAVTSSYTKARIVAA